MHFFLNQRCVAFGGRLVKGSWHCKSNVKRFSIPSVMQYWLCVSSRLHNFEKKVEGKRCMQPILRLFIALTCIWKAIGRVASLARNYKTLTLIFSTLYFIFVARECGIRESDHHQVQIASGWSWSPWHSKIAFYFLLSPLRSASHGVNRARFKPVIWNFSSFFLSNFGAQSGDESEYTSFEILISIGEKPESVHPTR